MSGDEQIYPLPDDQDAFEHFASKTSLEGGALVTFTVRWFDRKHVADVNFIVSKDEFGRPDMLSGMYFEPAVQMLVEGIVRRLREHDDAA